MWGGVWVENVSRGGVGKGGRAFSKTSRGGNCWRLLKIAENCFFEIWGRIEGVTILSKVWPPPCFPPPQTSPPDPETPHSPTPPSTDPPPPYRN